jgi:hypothetical protein
VIVNINGDLITTLAPVDTVRLLQIAFVPIIICPLVKIASVFASGTALELQLAGFSHAELAGVVPGPIHWVE